jgi:hypothetical protein
MNAIRKIAELLCMAWFIPLRKAWLPEDYSVHTFRVVTNIL